MKIMQISNSYTKPQVQPSFGERDEWGGPKAFDPWVREKMELEDKYIKKSTDLFSDYHNDKISFRVFKREKKLLEEWFENGKNAIAEKWHSVSINYEPPKPKKNFIQRLFKLK